MANLTKEDIAAKLKGIERYNPLHIEILTEYLNAQCKKNRSDVVEKILLKALTNLPHPDFILCELLIDSSKLGEGNIQEIIQMHKRLELCEFKAFWAALVNQTHLFRDIEGFEESIRNFVCHIVGITYQHVRATLLKEVLGYEEKEEEYQDLLKKRDWRPNDAGYVLITNQEDKIKTINITEKIELEQVANIMGTYR